MDTRWKFNKCYQRDVLWTNRVIQKIYFLYISWKFAFKYTITIGMWVGRMSQNATNIFCEIFRLFSVFLFGSADHSHEDFSFRFLRVVHEWNFFVDFVALVSKNWWNLDSLAALGHFECIFNWFEGRWSFKFHRFMIIFGG